MQVKGTRHQPNTTFILHQNPAAGTTTASTKTLPFSKLPSWFVSLISASKVGKVEGQTKHKNPFFFPNIIALVVLGLDAGYLNLTAAAKHTHKN